MTAIQLIDEAEEKHHGRLRVLDTLIRWGYACPVCRRLLAAGAPCPYLQRHVHTGR